MAEELVKDSARSLWRRGLLMLLFAIIYNLAELVLGAVALFQFVAKLATDKTNPRLLEFGQSLSVFVYQIWRFLTFNSEVLPFPFGPWPTGTANDQTEP